MMNVVMKKVSVIIPFYSGLDWLYDAVDSVFSQTYSNYEVILVNDGSDEDLTDFLKKYGDRIIYIYQENSGPGAARNAGIRRATGDYIAFEDSDDIWFPTKLEKQIAFMEKIGAKWCHTGFNYWWPETGKTLMVNSSRDYDDVYMQRHVSTKIATPTIILARSIFGEHDFFFPEDIRNGEDGYLYTKIAKNYPLALVQEPLVNVRMRGTNSQTHALERFNLRARSYSNWKNEGKEITFMLHVIYMLYSIFSLILGSEPSPIKERIAKCLWAFPYVLERIYVRYLYVMSTKSEKFILRYSPG